MTTTFTFSTWEGYLEAWQLCMRMGGAFCYIRDSLLISGNFNSYTNRRLSEIAEGEKSGTSA